MRKPSRRPIVVVALAAVLLGAFASPASAKKDGPVVFTVDSVEDLYVAVSVPGAIVNVSPGEYLLDPALDQTPPNDGRLDLADGVDLRGPSRLSAGAHGLPDTDEAGAPVFRKGEPAVIDGSNLPPDTFGAGIIVIGDKGTVRDMWVRGSVDPANPDPSAGFLGRPGIEIQSRGKVTGNVVERTTLGVRVRSGSGDTVTGTVTGNFVMDSGLMGLVAIPVGADDTFTSGSSIKANFRANRIVRTGFNGMLIVGGLSGDDNVVTVRTSDNFVQYASIGMFVEIRSGGGLDPDPNDTRGASRNTVTFTSTRDSMDGVAGGYLISGAIREYLADPGGGPPLIGEESSDNTIVGKIQDASIQNASFFDIVAEAATTAVFPPPDDAPVSGSNNAVTLTLKNIRGSGNPFNVFVADSTPPAPGSGNDAVIIGSRRRNEKANTGLDFTLVADSDLSK